MATYGIVFTLTHFQLHRFNGAALVNIDFEFFAHICQQLPVEHAFVSLGQGSQAVGLKRLQLGTDGCPILLVVGVKQAVFWGGSQTFRPTLFAVLGIVGEHCPKNVRSGSIR